MKSRVKNSLCFSFKFLVIFFQISLCFLHIPCIFREISRKKYRKFYEKLRRFDRKFLMTLVAFSDFLDLNKLFRVISTTNFIISDFPVFSGKINFIQNLKNKYQDFFIRKAQILSLKAKNLCLLKFYSLLFYSVFILIF